ncbi:MAG: hypothetical protein GXP26_10545 [Planctomycetes bacterium]|nr:hypothetical protein [Planctomycetota bacterium]
MPELTSHSQVEPIPWWKPVFFASLAGGMAWGIRGQYGHETGAMIAGLLVSLTLTYLLCPRASSISLAKAVAWGTLAMGIGGTMTYGQTVGLTQDSSLIGNWVALRWGMLGFAIKGGIWIGFAGAFLGMGWSSVRYRAREIFLLMLSLLGAHLLGVYLLNTPFDPAHHELPSIYFSDDWRWEPEGELTPRFEQWGGLLLALTTLIAYTGWYRQDRLACRLALWGVLGGAIGFPAGQTVQAFNAWNREMLAGTWWDDLQMNWWNMMETIFGAVMGAMLGLGAWLNRVHIQPAESETQMPLALEFGLLAIHLPMLLAVEFLAISQVDALYDLGLIMVLIPMVAVAGGRWWPYLQVLPLTMIPIAGKTVRTLAHQSDGNIAVSDWLCYVIIPLLVATLFAIWYGRESQRQRDGLPFVRWSLLLATWTYFCLNYAIFDFPWPWSEWTGRTCNGLIFTFCAVGLTVLVLLPRKDAGSKITKNVF